MLLINRREKPGKQTTGSSHWDRTILCDLGLSAEASHCRVGLCWGCNGALPEPPLGCCNHCCAPRAQGDAGSLEDFQRASPQMRGGREQLDEESLKEFSINNFSK